MLALQSDAGSFVGSGATVSLYGYSGRLLTLNVEDMAVVNASWPFWSTFSLNTLTGAWSVAGQTGCAPPSGGASTDTPATC